MKPIRDRVLIRHARRPEQSEGGIFYPANARGLADEGIVIQVGTMVEDPEIQVGDRVLFIKRKGQVVPVKLEEETAHLRLLDEADVLAKVDVGSRHVCAICGGQGFVVLSPALSGAPGEETNVD